MKGQLVRHQLLSEQLLEVSTQKMTIQKFEDIIAWQKAQDLAAEIYRYFGSIKDFGFRDQICRAAISISNNIAEGFDRGTNKEFSLFLSYARASSSEIKSMLYLAERLCYVTTAEAERLRDLSSEFSKIINGLKKSITEH